MVVTLYIKYRVMRFNLNYANKLYLDLFTYFLKKS